MVTAPVVEMCYTIQTTVYNVKNAVNSMAFGITERGQAKGKK